MDVIRAGQFYPRVKSYQCSRFMGGPSAPTAAEGAHRRDEDELYLPAVDFLLGFRSRLIRAKKKYTCHTCRFSPSPVTCRNESIYEWSIKIELKRIVKNGDVF